MMRTLGHGADRTGPDKLDHFWAKSEGILPQRCGHPARLAPGGWPGQSPQPGSIRKDRQTLKKVRSVVQVPLIDLELQTSAFVLQNPG